MQRTDSFEKTLMWERLKAGERNDTGWGGWMVSPTQWAWVWARFRSWWWTGKPSVLQAVGWSWTEQMNWTELRPIIWLLFPHLTHSRTLPWGAHAHLSRGGSQSEGFWEKQDSSRSGVIPWLLTHKESFCACVVSLLSQKREEADPLIVHSNKVFPSLSLPQLLTLTIAMIITLRYIQETNAYYTLFLLLLPFWRANRRLIVNALTGAHLSIVSENANSFKYPAWSPLLCTPWNVNRRPVVNV